jgi:hypothetical protein
MENTYKVVRKDTAEELSDAVSNYMSYGWIPHGGVFVHASGQREVYSQALILPREAQQ